MSEYDGHDDYRKDLQAEQARVEAIESHPLASLADKLLGFAEWGLGAGVAITAGYQVVQGLCGVVRCGNAGHGGLLFLMAGGITGLIAIGSFKAAVNHWRYEWRPRLIADGVAVIAVFAFLLLPLHRSGEVAKARDAEQRGKSQILEAEQQKAAAAWMAGLRARGDHGPPGAVPPQLRVEHQGTDVTVTNASPQPLTIALARVREDADLPGGWRACTMHTAGSRGDKARYYYYSLAAGARATWRTLEPCAEAFRDAAIEYRVGRYPGDTGWWSDSAFAAPQGREYANGR